MNWIRGFIRIWIATTILWFGAVAFFAYEPVATKWQIAAEQSAQKVAWRKMCEANLQTESKNDQWADFNPVPTYCLFQDQAKPDRFIVLKALSGYLIIALLLPLGLLACWFVGVWVCDGFGLRVPHKGTLPWKALASWLGSQWRILIFGGSAAYFVAGVLVTIMAASNSEGHTILALETLILGPLFLFLLGLGGLPTVLFVGLATGTPVVSIGYGFGLLKRNWKILLCAFLQLSALAATIIALLP